MHGSVMIQGIHAFWGIEGVWGLHFLVVPALSGPFSFWFLLA